jgi:hypothetical protein
MRVHRIAHARDFLVLPNYLLQDRRLSYTARGLLADLLSRQDGWREDGRHMADSSPQGRLAVGRALRELAAAGYYRVDKIRQPDGTFSSQAHVFDVPQQVGPSPTHPGTGGSGSGNRGSNPVKNREIEPSFPGAAAEERPKNCAEEGPGLGAGGQKIPIPDQPSTDEPVGEAVAVLLRVIRSERRLRLGTIEALELAPLVTSWLDRGSTQVDLERALLAGLPAQIASAARLLRYRLVHRMPPIPEATQAFAASAAWFECGTCGDPVAQEGICRPCAGLGGRTVAVGRGEAATTRGGALVRAAMRAGQSQHAAGRG